MNRFNSVSDFSPSFNSSSSSSTTPNQRSQTSSAQQQRSNLKCYPIEIDSLLLNSSIPINTPNPTFKSNKCFQAPKKPSLSGFSASTNTLYSNMSQDTNLFNDFGSDSCQKIQNSMSFLPSIYNTTQHQHQKAAAPKTPTPEIPNYLPPSSDSLYKQQEKSNSFETSNFLSKSFSTTLDTNRNYTPNFEFTKLNSSKSPNSRFNNTTAFAQNREDRGRFALDPITNPLANNDSAVWKPPSMLKQNYKSFNSLLNNLNDEFNPGSNFKSIEKPFRESDNGDLRTSFNELPNNSSLFLKKDSTAKNQPPKIPDWRSIEMRFIDDDNKDGNVLMIERDDDEDFEGVMEKQDICSNQTPTSTKNYNSNFNCSPEVANNYSTYKKNIEYYKPLTTTDSSFSNVQKDSLNDEHLRRRIFSNNTFLKNDFDTINNNQKIPTFSEDDSKIQKEFTKYNNSVSEKMREGSNSEVLDSAFSESLDSSQKSNQNLLNLPEEAFLNTTDSINNSSLGLNKGSRISMNDSGISTNTMMDNLLTTTTKNNESFLFDSSSSGFLDDDDDDDDEINDSEGSLHVYPIENEEENSHRSSLVVRQQPFLRVKAIIDKLLYMTGRDQRRALFSLKSIFQNDKDLVHEFVQNGGLECLIKLGKNSDQNHQNHILRAIGQLMLYVDGMNGIIMHNETICWLYELLDSPYRLVVKTALKLLLVFVEYTESNSLLLLAAISKIDKAKERQDWFSLMRILNERQASDEETLIFGITVINKTLNGVPDQDTFFDVIDALESQGLEEALKEMIKLNNTQLTQQCNHYEQELRKEDAALESDSSNNNNEPALVKMRVNGALLNSSTRNSGMRRSKFDLDSSSTQQQNQQQQPLQTNKNLIKKFENQPNSESQNGFKAKNQEVSKLSQNLKNPTQQNGDWRKNADDKLAQELAFNLGINNNNSIIKQQQQQINEGISAQNRNFQNAALEICAAAEEGKENIIQLNEKEEEERQMKAPPPSIPTNIFSPTESKVMDFPDPLPPKEQAPVEEVVVKPTKKETEDDEEATISSGGFAALLQKRAKKMEGSAFRKGLVMETNKQSESELKWKEAAEKLKEKPMIINDLDFSEFVEFEQDPLILVKVAQVAQERGLLPSTGGGGGGGGATKPQMSGPGGIPPPPPPAGPGFAPPPPPPPGGPVPPPPPPGSLKTRESSPGPSNGGGTKTGTMKLHWKPAQSDAPPVPALKRKGTFWNKVATTPQIDPSKLSRLFEQKTKEAPVKKAGGEAKPQVLQVLSVKRSQAINIGLTKLPPISVIPTAIRKFDATVLNKEGIEKILGTMMPSSEEIERIHEKQAENPDTPLGQAEQFMLSLSDIDCLLERLRLWLFMLDYQNLEKDVAESLMELNNAMKEIEESKTFRVAMGMLLTIGNALNGTDIKAFQLDYLSKASEVKDPVHKYPLTHHLAEYMLDNYPEGSDLYSELGAVSRSSRLDFDAVTDNLKKMETDCKSSFDYVAKISQKDNNSSMKNKVNIFLAEVAERIHRLKHVHRTTLHRWSAFLLYFGYSPAEVKDQKPLAVFKMVIEFALEYRTNRDKILQMRKRMLEKRERNKTRGMMIGVAQGTNVAQRRSSKSGPAADGPSQKDISDRERHQEMSRLLTGGAANGGTAVNDGTFGRRRVGPTPERNLIAAQTEALRKSPADGESPDDELLDGVVRTVTAQAADPRDHNRRRARLFNRKSLRRTRTIRQDQLPDLNNLNNY